MTSVKRTICSRSRTICLSSHAHSQRQSPNPRLDLRFQNIKGNCAVTQNGVVESADIETRAKFLLGFGSKLEDFELTYFVAERLTGPDDVTIDFDDDVLISFCRIFPEEVDCL